MEITKYKLTKVCDFQGGSQPPKKEWSKNEKVGYVRMLQIRDFTQATKDNVEYVKDSNSIKKCKKDDVLIGRYGASIGKILTGLEGAYNVAIMKTIPKEKLLNKEYLLAFLKAPLFQNFIQNIGGRAAQAGFNKEDLSKFNISLPSIDNQKRIAKVLSDCETLIKKRKESIKLLDDLLQSTFLEMFGDNKGITYKFKDLEDKTSKGTFSNGPFGSDLLSSELKKSGVPVIYIRDLKNRKFNWISNVYVTKLKANTLITCQVEPNDILISKVGTPPGTTVIYPKGLETAIITQDVVRLRVNESIVKPEFIKYWMNSPYGQFRLRSITVQGTRQRFGLGDLKKMNISIPSIDLQKKFVKKVEKVENLTQDYQIHLEELENLYCSLSQLAFKGHLDVSKILLREIKYFSTDSNETPEDFKKKMEGYIGEIETPVAGSLKVPKVEDKTPKFSKKDIEKLKIKPKQKKDITDLSLADFYGIPLNIQARRENIDFDFIGDDIFYQFLLKDHFKNESFTSQDLFEKLHNHFYHNGDMDFDNVKWKNIIFQFLDSKPPLLEQIFDESDNTVKLKLTDEAYKA